MLCGSGVSKSRLAKAAGAEVAVQQRHEKLQAFVARSKFQVKISPRKMMGSGHFLKFRCRKNGTWLWREAHLQGKMHTIPAFWSTFGGFSVAKVSGRLTFS